jgi:hypothetical protein
MQDIYGIMELAKEKGTRPLLLSGKGTSTRTESGKRGRDDVSEHTTYLWKVESEVSKVAVKLYGRIDPNSNGLRTLNQLGLLNPASLVWELVPWSFVVDWFCPIGPVLNAMTAPAGLTFVTGTLSCKVTQKGSYETHWTVWDEYANTNVPATGETYNNSYTRSVYGSWPRPGFWFNSDPFAGDRPLKALALTIANLRNLRV